MSTEEKNNDVIAAIGEGTAIPMLRLGDERVGRQLRYYRRTKGLSQTALAGLAGVSQATVSRAERNPGSATVGQIQSMCAALGVTVFDLLEDTPAYINLDKARSLRTKDLTAVPATDSSGRIMFRLEHSAR